MKPLDGTDHEFNLTPNFKGLFDQFLRDADNAGQELPRQIMNVITQSSKAMRIFQGFLAPATIALQCATSVAEIERLREMMANTLTKLDNTANALTNAMTDLTTETDDDAEAR
jgi:stage V sporulation protein SpoVS